MWTPTRKEHQHFRDGRSCDQLYNYSERMTLHNQNSEHHPLKQVLQYRFLTLHFHSKRLPWRIQTQTLLYTSLYDFEY